MYVEAAPVDLHEAHALLDQPLGEQAAAAEFGAAVTVAGGVVDVVELEGTQGRALHQPHGVFGGGARGGKLLVGRLLRETGVHAGEGFQTLVAAQLADSLGEGQVRILFAGTADEKRFALLAQVAGSRALAADDDERRQVAQRGLLADYHVAQSRVREVREGEVAGLQLIGRPAVIAVVAGDGADQRDVVHLLGELAGRSARSARRVPRCLIGENSPWVGRPGLGSQVSMWLMPPPFQNRITFSAVGA